MTAMFRMFRGRWFWSIAGIVAASYLLRRSRRSPVEALRYTTDRFSADDVARVGRYALDVAVQAGRTIADGAAKALSRR